MPSDKNQPLPIGTILDGKFRVTKEIGRGGMAAVFEAENIDIGKRVAVKVLAAELVTSRVVTERFIREARAAAAVRSPYICDVYDVGMFDDRPFLVMELLEGESLYDRLSRVRRLDIDLTVRVARQTAKGLSKAHEAGIVHRDLKPENIFLTRNEEGEIVAKLLDFGLAKFYEPANEGGPAARLTKEGALFGTPAYMSPEQAKAQGEVDHRSDLWAIGCIIYECLTGRTVWNVDQGVAMILAQIAGAPIPRPSRYRDDLPKSFDDWFRKALSRDPKDRFQSARELSDALVLALSPSGGYARQTSLHTEHEGEDVDKLVNKELSSPRAAQVVTASSPNAYVAPPNDDAAVPLPATLPPAARARGPGFAIMMLLLAGALMGGAYYLVFYKLYPPGDGGPLRGFISRAAEMTERRRGAGSEHDPVETEPYALQVHAGQLRLARGESEAALRLFQEAFGSSKSNAARSFLAHAEVQRENTLGGACRVTGLGRPRPFSVSEEPPHPTDTPVSLPGLALTKAGIVVAWAEQTAQRKRQVFTTILDSSLQRIQPVVNITPEGASVQEPMLWRAGGALVVTYWDAIANTGSSEPGIFVRALDDMGRIAGPPRRIFATERRQSFPALANAPDGTLWAVWTERTNSKVSDLVLRRLDAKLLPLGDAVRLTSYSIPKTGVSTASRAALAVAHGHLNIAFAVERNLENQVFLLRVDLQDPALRAGGLPIASEAEAAAQESDRFLGKIIPVSTGAGKHNEPDIACIEDGCYVVWDDEKAGADAAFVAAPSGEVVWRREIGPKALRPSITSSEREVALVWYEDKRLRFARMSKTGPERPSVLARGSGVQPAPVAIPGESPGQWYVSWRDFEAARPEAFVLRAECR